MAWRYSTNAAAAQRVTLRSWKLRSAPRCANQLAQRPPMPRMRNPHAPPNHPAIGSRQACCLHRFQQCDRLQFWPDIFFEDRRVRLFGLIPLPLGICEKLPRVSLPAELRRLSAVGRIVSSQPPRPKYRVSLRNCIQGANWSAIGAVSALTPREVGTADNARLRNLGLLASQAASCAFSNRIPTFAAVGLREGSRNRLRAPRGLLRIAFPEQLPCEPFRNRRNSGSPTRCGLRKQLSQWRHDATHPLSRLEKVFLSKRPAFPLGLARCLTEF